MPTTRTELYDARKKAGLTQEQIAERVGIDRTYFNAIENGRRRPALDIAIRIAQLLGVEVTDIFLPSDVTLGNSIGGELHPDVGR